MEPNPPAPSDSMASPRVPVHPAPISEEKPAPPAPVKAEPAVSSRKSQAPASSSLVIFVAVLVAMGLAALAVLAYTQSKR